jgi:hypothetical protein
LDHLFLLLHLPQVRRSSRDIDIVSPATDAERDRVVARIGQTASFTRPAEVTRAALCRP